MALISFHFISVFDLYPALLNILYLPGQNASGSMLTHIFIRVFGCHHAKDF